VPGNSFPSDNVGIPRLRQVCKALAHVNKSRAGLENFDMAIAVIFKLTRICNFQGNSNTLTADCRNDSIEHSAMDKDNRNAQILSWLWKPQKELKSMIEKSITDTEAASSGN